MKTLSTQQIRVLKKILCIYRHWRYSPHSVERDAAILEAVGDKLRDKGCQVTFVHEENADEKSLRLLLAETDLCFSMARSESVVRVLRESGVPTVNTPQSVALCSRRKELERLMRSKGIPVPPASGTSGYWMKRGDGPVQTPDDVVFCSDETALEAARTAFLSRGIGEVVVSAHVEGDVLKFYGVSGSPFFCYCYPAETGQTKFGMTAHNGILHHYAFDADALHGVVGQLATYVGVSVYGGDCVVRPDGSFVIIDFNDWPSFACCRDEAAETIADMFHRL